jgi:hypothetical protein
MNILSIRTQELYEEFRNLNPRIVRSGHQGDAFTLLVLETIFYNLHSVKKFNRKANLDFIEKCVVPPPDDYIDIFYEETDLEERKYHIVQVKDSDLDTGTIETCFIKMKYSIDTFLNSRKDSKKNLKKIIALTDFSKEYEDSCIYYVVHRGKTEHIRNQKKNQVIITEDKLISLREVIEGGSEDESVPSGTFEIDTANNFILHNFVDSKSKKVDSNLPQSLLCNFSGYDLAKLDQKYADTELGRNILYGGNLRESLNKKSKTYASMIKTIDEEPELFLFYNNGITILADYFNSREKDSNSKEKIILKKFSIINGAQTTSTLGSYLREAEINNDSEKIEKLKKVFVLTKIYEINSKLVNHKNTSENIKLYNNTQTPLSSRDMVSIRPEQKHLQRRLIEGSPNIFVNIKKGEGTPQGYRLLNHQKVTNETLAQLALCGFSFQPFTAKDKKIKIFENDGKEDVLLNPIYDRLFNERTGTLFTRNQIEIDELLFIHRLHEDTKSDYRKSLNEDIQNLIHSPLTEGHSNEDREKEISLIKRNLDISNKCLFYSVTCYYKVRQRFDSKIPNIKNLSFDTKRYYDDKNYREGLIDSFQRLFFTNTVEIIRKKSEGDNITNWVRIEGNEKIFLDALFNKLTDQPYLAKDYEKFVESYKTIHI